MNDSERVLICEFRQVYYDLRAQIQDAETNGAVPAVLMTLRQAQTIVLGRLLNCGIHPIDELE